MLESRGLDVTDLGIGLDDPDQMNPLLKQGLKHDLFLLSGGVSAGTLDLVPHLLSQLGVEKVFHSVKVKPGKPIYFGFHSRADGSRGYVFGLPGNPVSSLVGFRLFVEEAISRMCLEAKSKSTPQLAKLSKDHETRGDRPTFWPAKRVASPDATLVVEPLNWNGSSDLVALGHAEGLIAFPPEGKLYPVGSEFPFWVL
jgi:molybdopterin molybdotransferase